MRFCKYCNRNVRPHKSWSWIGFIFGFGIFYLAYYFLKTPSCPICGSRLGFLRRD